MIESIIRDNIQQDVSFTNALSESSREITEIVESLADALSHATDVIKRSRAQRDNGARVSDLDICDVVTFARLIDRARNLTR